MLNLMRLEMKKFHLGSYVKGAIIANFVILGFCLLFYLFLKLRETQGLKIMRLL